MEFSEFRTEPDLFHGWKKWVHTILGIALGIWLLNGVFRFVGGLDIHGAWFWMAYFVLGFAALAVFAAVNLVLWLLFAMHLSNYNAAQVRGITKPQPDGSMVVVSTRDGHEIAHCKPGCRKSIVVGLDWFQQTHFCTSRRKNSEPVFVSLYCAGSGKGDAIWIDLFSITHDRRDIIVSVNDEEIRFPYHGRPDYGKIAKRVAHSCPAFALLEVHDASEK